MSRALRRQRLATVATLAVLAVLAVALPWLTNPYIESVAALAGVYTILTVSWNIMGGFGGLFSLGHAGFFGAGAYVCAMLVGDVGLPWWLALLGAAGGGALLALLVIPCFRTGGAYFAVLTLALAETLRLVGNRLLPGKHDGKAIDPVFDPTGHTSYLVVVVVLALAIALSYAVRRSDFGLALSALRSDEEAAEASGVDTAKLKVAVLCLSAALAGVAGGLYTITQTFITPNSVLSLDFSVLPLLMAILGGIGTVLGPVIGGIVWSIVNELLRESSDSGAYAIMVYGAVLALLATVMPRGLAGVAQALWSRRPSRWWTTDAADPNPIARP